MKTFLSIVFLLSCLIGCSEDTNFLSSHDRLTFRKIAYESLTEESRAILAENWRFANVDAGIYQLGNYGHKIVIDTETSLPIHPYNPDYKFSNSQQLVAVSFRTIYMVMGGPIIKIIDYKSKIVIGFVPTLG